MRLVGLRLVLEVVVSLLDICRVRFLSLDVHFKRVTFVNEFFADTDVELFKLFGLVF